jgi:transposase
MAGLIRRRPGRPARLIYRTQIYRGRTGEKEGCRAREFAALLRDMHRHLDAPIILIRGNASTHHALKFRKFCERNTDWLTVHKLPPYSPELNPVEMGLPQCGPRRAAA